MIYRNYLTTTATIRMTLSVLFLSFFHFCYFCAKLIGVLIITKVFSKSLDSSLFFYLDAAYLTVFFKHSILIHSWYFNTDVYNRKSSQIVNICSLIQHVSVWQPKVFGDLNLWLFEKLIEFYFFAYQIRNDDSKNSSTKNIHRIVLEDIDSADGFKDRK